MHKYDSKLLHFTASKTIPGYGPHITVINHDADSASQKGSSGSLGQAGTSSAGTFLGPPGRVSMITGAPSPHQVRIPARCSA